MKKLAGYFFAYVAVIYFPLLMHIYGFALHNSDDLLGKGRLPLFVGLFHLLPSALVALIVYATSLYNENSARRIHSIILVMPVAVSVAAGLFMEPSAALWLLPALILAGISGWNGFGALRSLNEFFKVAGIFILVYTGYFLYSVGAFEARKTYSVYDTPFATRAVDEARGHPPTFIIVFDEFSMIPLLDERGEISREFPNFRKLAREAYWFKNAAANYDTTERSVSSMLLGSYVEEKEKDAPLPDTAQFRGRPNLFNIAASRYRLKVVAYYLNYCEGKPDFDCEDRGSYTFRDPFLSLKVFFSQFATVGRYMLCKATGDDCRMEWDVIIEVPYMKRQRDILLAAAGEKELDGRLVYIHSYFPHWPYIFRRDGSMEIEGRNLDFWTSEASPEILDEIYQKYVEQIRYTDKLIGEVIERLKASGNWKKINFIVTSDHGVGWEPGAKYRNMGVMSDSIAFIPFFIKPAFLEKGGPREDYYQHINFLPTVLDAMNLRAPVELPGYSVLGRSDDLPIHIRSKDRWFQTGGRGQGWERVSGHPAGQEYETLKERNSPS